MTMVENSVLVHFFMSLGAVLGSGWESSRVAALFRLTGRLLTGIWRILVGAWEGSALRRLLDRLEQWGRQAVRGSALCRFACREGRMTAAWQSSLLCRGLNVLLNLPCALVRWLARVGGGALEGSLLFRGCCALGGAAWGVLGAFLLLMLVVPHENWNNLYCVGGVAVIALLFAMNSAADSRTRLEAERLSPWYVLFLSFVVYGMVCSLEPALSVRHFLFHVGCFVIVLLAVSAVRSVEQLQRMVALPVIGVTVASLYGCYQGWVGVEVVPSQQDMVLNAGMPGRIYAFFDNPNNYAELLVMLMPFLLALFLNAPGRRGRVLAVLAMVPCVVAIGLTLSRSGWIGLVVGVAVFPVLQNWRYLLLFLVLGLCALPLLPKTILNRILTIGNLQDTSTSYRLSIYSSAFTMLKDHGLFGVGLDPDVVHNVFTTYPPMFDGNHPIHTHNNYVQMWAELGIFGGLAYVAALLSQLKRGALTYWHTADRQVKNLLGAALGAFCGILVIGVAEYTWFYPRNMFIYWFLFGVIGACVKLGGGKKTADPIQ